MIRATNLSRVFQKRTLRPLYQWPNIIPNCDFLDKKETRVILPGNVMTKVNGIVRPAHSLDIPYGLSNNFVNGTMDELGGLTEMGVWPLEGVFEVLIADVDGMSTTEYTNFTDGDLLYTNDLGWLTNKGTFSIGTVLEMVKGSRIDKIIVELGAGLPDPIVKDPDYLEFAEDLNEVMRDIIEKTLAQQDAKWKTFDILTSSGLPVPDSLYKELDSDTSWP